MRLADEVVLLEQEISTLVKELMELHDRLRSGSINVRPAAVALREVIGVEALMVCVLCSNHYYFVDDQERCVFCAKMYTD